MKILKTVVCLLAFCAVDLVVARPTGNVGQPRPANQPNQPVTPPAPQQQAPKATYKQLHDNILKNNTGIFAGNKFNDTYITQAISAAKSAEIGEEGLRALLQTARDQWAPFTGNDAVDLGILKSINQQIETAAAQM